MFRICQFPITKFTRHFSSSSTVLLTMKRRRTAIVEVEDDSIAHAQEARAAPVNIISCTTGFDRAVTLAAASLQAGKLIALPTDTLYGIAGLAQSSSAVKRIYEVKERDFKKPLAICVARSSEVHRWAHVTVTESLLTDLLPGPVTLVFERRSALNPELNPGTNLIGVRVPDDLFIRRLTTECREPLALTSANKSGAVSPLSIDEFRDLWPFLDLIVDGGTVGSTAQESYVDRSRLGSTVVDLSEKGCYRVIRDGRFFIFLSRQHVQSKYILYSAMKATMDILHKHGLMQTIG